MLVVQNSLNTKVKLMIKDDTQNRFLPKLVLLHRLGVALQIDYRLGLLNAIYLVLKRLVII